MNLFKYTTEEEQLEAVKKDPCEIRFIHNPSEEVQLEAVKNNPYSIEYIKNPSASVIRYVIENCYDKDPEIIQSMKFDYNKLPDDLKILLEF